MTEHVRARPDLLVVGIGNPLRRDDAVGLHLVRRLDRYFQRRLNCMALMAPDVAYAEKISRFRKLLVIDAMPLPDDEPYRMVRLAPGPHPFPSGGWVSHVFDWTAILALTVVLYDRSPEAELLGVAAGDFGISESLSPSCARNADSAFRFLVAYCSR
jgi:hydrogenase maturation protease